MDLSPSLSASDQWRIVVDVAHKAENLGFDGVWVYDHFHTFPVKQKRSVFEAWTTLTALAPLTKTVRLGQLVTCYAYRTPVLLAKVSSCLDVISNGRLELGIGAGWYEEEFRGYGICYQKPAVRIAQLRETIEIVKRMWTEEATTYCGKYYHVENAFNHPKPVQKPHPPITIGGGGERLTLKVVAQYADRWNLDLPYGLEDCKRKLGVLQDHCRNIGRSFDQIEISVHRDLIVDKDQSKVDAILKRRYEEYNSWLEAHNRPELAYENFLGRSFHGTPRQCTDQIQRFVDVGVSHFIVHFPNSAEITPLEVFAEEIAPGLIKK